VNQDAIALPAIVFWWGRRSDWGVAPDVPEESRQRQCAGIAAGSGQRIFLIRCRVARTFPYGKSCVRAAQLSLPVL
jgi:hypothetical protein